jgi:hypothetical protein
MLPDLGLLEHSMGGFSRRKRIRALEALVLDNPSAGNYEELGDLLLEEKQYDRARDAFNRALAVRTDAIDPFYKRGLAALALGDAAAAVPDLEHVVKADPKYDYRRAQLFYAVALAANGQSNEAAAVYQGLVENSGTTEVLCHAAEFYAAQGRKGEARELLERIAMRKRTMPSYQKRRERSLLRRASSLRRRLPLTN